MMITTMNHGSMESWVHGIMDIDVVRLIEEVQPMEAIMIRLIIDFAIDLIMINVIDLVMIKR